MSEKVPDNWVWVKAEELVKDDAPILYGILQPGPDIKPNGVPYIRPTEIQNDKIVLSEIRYTSTEIAKKYKRSILEEGDIVLSMVGTIGKVAFVPSVLIGGNITQSSVRIRVRKNINNKYFFYCLKSPFLTKQYEKSRLGTAVPRLNVRDIRDLNFPIAPYPEQKRIAEKLDCLLSKVDACKVRLDKVPEIIKRFRQSVLSDAVSGKLTEDWREEDANLDNAKDILKTTIKCRENAYKDAVLKAELSGLKKPRPFKVSEGLVNSQELPNLPNGWIWEKLVNISHIQGGVTKGRKLDGKQTISLPYLRVANVQDGFLNLSEVKNINVLPEDKEKYKLIYGDILFTEGGDRDKLGRGTIWRDEIRNCIHQNHIFRARLYCPTILPDYISITTKSETARKYFFDNANQTVNLASINMTTLGNTPIAIAPEKEQVEICRRVDAMFSVAAQLEDKLKTAKARVEKLSSSILSKAFRGELVPQDPDDEPAELLLERIRAERKTLAANNKKGKRTPKKKSSPEKGGIAKTDDTDGEISPATAIQTETIQSGKKDKTTKLKRQSLARFDRRFEKADVLQAFRKATVHQTDIAEYALLRLVGQRLGVRRLSRQIRQELESYIRTAMRRKIIARSDDGYTSATPTIQHYDDEDLIKVLKSVIRNGYEYERAQVVNDAATYLGFDKVSDAFAERMKAIFRTAIRRGELYRNGNYVGKP